MDLQDSVQRSLQNPAEKNHADLHRFAKIENPGTQDLTKNSRCQDKIQYRGKIFKMSNAGKQ